MGETIGPDANLSELITYDYVPPTDDELHTLWQRAWEAHYTRPTDPHHPSTKLLRTFSELVRNFPNTDWIKIQDQMMKAYKEMRGEGKEDESG